MQLPPEMSSNVPPFDSDSNFDPLVNLKEENSNSMQGIDYQSHHHFMDENSTSNLFQFDSNSRSQQPELTENDSFAPSNFEGFNFDSNDFSAETSNADSEVIPMSQFAQPPQDFLINEESQDPEDMAKLLLGDISDSGSSDSDQNDE